MAKIILIILVLAAIGYGVFYFFGPKAVTPVTVVPNGRTLYEGRVNIETISLAEFKTKLDEGRVYYTVEGNALTIYPHGQGFGPVSFIVKQNTLSATKDIAGIPDPEKYKQAVRQDVKDIGGIITIRENSWKITKTTYPWSVVY